MGLSTPTTRMLVWNTPTTPRQTPRMHIKAPGLSLLRDCTHSYCVSFEYKDLFQSCCRKRLLSSNKTAKHFPLALPQRFSPRTTSLNRNGTSLDPKTGLKDSVVSRVFVELQRSRPLQAQKPPPQFAILELLDQSRPRYHGAP